MLNYAMNKKLSKPTGEQVEWNNFIYSKKLLFGLKILCDVYTKHIHSIIIYG